VNRFGIALGSITAMAFGGAILLDHFVPLRHSKTRPAASETSARHPVTAAHTRADRDTVTDAIDDDAQMTTPEVPMEPRKQPAAPAKATKQPPFATEPPSGASRRVPSQR
jgi:hypothetical protein